MGANTLNFSDVLHHLKHYLPQQGPLFVFIHHNTLHAFEKYEFKEALSKASQFYGAHFREPVDTFHHLLEENKVSKVSIEMEIKDFLKKNNLHLSPDMMLALQEYIQLPQFDFNEATAEWCLGQIKLTQAPLLESFLNNYLNTKKVRSKSELLDFGSLKSIESQVNTQLIRYLSLYLDQGISFWANPFRAMGLWRYLSEQVKKGLSALEPWGSKLKLELSQYENKDAQSICEEELKKTGLSPELQSEWLKRVLFALPNWAGMISLLEQKPQLFPSTPVKLKLTEYLAFRLVVTRVLIERKTPNKSITQLVSENSGEDFLALKKCLKAKLFSWASKTSLSIEVFSSSFPDFLRAIDLLNEDEVKKIFMFAYEREYFIHITEAINTHFPKAIQKKKENIAQLIFCIDEREESLRRYIEELCPEIETHAAAGFFGMDISFRGIFDKDLTPFCPVIIEPKVKLIEKGAGEDTHRFLAREVFSRKVQRLFYLFSHDWIGGVFSTLGVGAFRIIPLLRNTFWPTHASLKKYLKEEESLKTEIVLEKDSEADSLFGYTLEEATLRIKNLLSTMGLVENFGEFIVAIAHGSMSVNNPHFSAYQCGACGGKNGSPNARVFAKIGNNLEVREALKAYNIHIPPSVHFIGGVHNTSSDSFKFFDLELLPTDSRKRFERIQSKLAEALAKNAKERARRFARVSFRVSEKKALKAVQARCSDISEARPELGHATNSLCIVGRRFLTQKLFLDRRAFLVSYNPNGDSEGKYLKGVLGAVVPVCTGINLEYFFSKYDPEVFGCGTKLPHNVVSLLGVMNGTSSDLRNGLPIQMTEVHEAVRLHMIIDCPIARIKKILEEDLILNHFLKNGWFFLSIYDEAQKTLYQFKGEVFEKVQITTKLEQVRKWNDYFVNKRESLRVVELQEAR